MDFKIAMYNLHQYKPFFKIAVTIVLGFRLETISSCAMDNIFKAPSEVIEILGTFLPNRINMAGCLFCQSLSTTTGLVRQVASGDKRFEVLFLDVYFRSNVLPVPIRGQVQTGKDPGLKLFPGIFGQEYPNIPKFHFELIKSLTPSFFAIPVDAQNEDVHHSFIALYDFRNSVRFHSFKNTAKAWVLADSNTCLRLTDGSKKLAEDRSQNVLILAVVFRDDENSHEPSSASS